MSIIKKRPKVGDVVRFSLRHGSAPGLVLDRLLGGRSRLVDLREGSRNRHVEVPDEDICYINGVLTGNESDDDY